MRRYLPFLLLASVFLLIKLSTFGVRLSDSNIYFYTGHLLLQGKTLYKDVFFTNFPLLPYASSLYILLTGGKLSLYYLTAAIESLITGFFIYHILYRNYKDRMLSLVCSSLYLFSFILLSTSDHQTGVFLASLFAVISYYFYGERKWLLTGIFIALAIMTKAYFLPIVITYSVMFFLNKSGEGESAKNHKPKTIDDNKLFHVSGREMAPFLVGFTSTVFIILLPSLLFAQHEFIKDVFQYSLTRSQGLSKTNILWFFLTHDLLLVASLLYSLVMIKTYRFFGILSLLSLLFILLYKDIYYLYLNFLVPFLCLAFANLYRDLQKRTQMQAMVLPTVVSIFLLISLSIYLTGYRDLQRLTNIDALTTSIKSLHPTALYGSNGTTHALAYLTDTPLVNKIIDTNPNIFRKGFLSATTLTNQALKEHALFVTEGVSFPEMGIEQPVIDEVIDVKVLQKKKCALVQSIPVKTEGYINRINLITCN